MDPVSTVQAVEESRGQPITFVTSSKKKIFELKLFFEPKNYYFNYVDTDLPEYQGEPEFITYQKCATAMKMFDFQPIIIEDTSLHFNALHGLPGPYVKWFDKKIGADGLYKLLSGFEDKSARAVTIVAFWEGPGSVKKPFMFHGEVEGTIVKPRGSFGFGWDPCFLPVNSDKTFAEMQCREKLEISQRGNALRQLVAHLDMQREKNKKAAKERKAYAT